ncbi:MAG TPA: YggS family pyridoxal phosphate-dependent enzyme [Jatrophihabitans sp.]
MHADARAAELATSLGALRSRIADACAAVGRDPHSVALIAVTKTYPASDVAALARLGVRDVGESKDQEARAKVDELADLPDPVRWHLVGRLQTNKARSVAGYAFAVHSVDRLKLARALADAVAREQGRAPLEVFVQVSLDGDPERGGVLEADLEALVDLVADRPELQLRGLMAVAPMAADPNEAFARLAELAEGVRRDHPGAQSISAGMSNDLEAAIANGATHVRVGTALLGRRATNFG